MVVYSAMISSGLNWMFITAIAVLMVKLILVATRQTKYAKLIDAIPGPPAPVPFLGNAWDLCGPHDEIFSGIVKLVSGFPKEPFIRIWLGTQGYLILKKSDAIEKILNSLQHLTKSDDYIFLHSWLGRGLITSTSEKWQERRKMLTPSFHFRILDDFIVIFNEQADILLKNLQKTAGKGQIDIYSYFTLCALDIICESAMGKSINAQINNDSDYVKAVAGMGEVVLARITRPWLQPPFIFNLTSWREKEKKCLKTMHDFTKQVIQERRTKFQQNCAEHPAEDNGILGQKKRLAFLDLLLSATSNGKSLTDEEIRQEVDTFMFAGHDTTAAGMTWVVYLLGRYPAIQKTLQEEIDSVLGDSNRPITHADLAQLKYLEAVIKEALRLYPSVPIYGRKLKESITLNGYHVPANTTIFIGAYFAHRDPDVFPDPENFDPTRFLKDNAQGRDPFAYIPFSAGPRNCIGQRFAIMEEKVVLARFVQNFSIVSHQKPEDLKLLIEPIFHPSEGIYVSLERRQ